MVAASKTTPPLNEKKYTAYEATTCAQVCAGSCRISNADQVPKAARFFGLSDQFCMNVVDVELFQKPFNSFIPLRLRLRNPLTRLWLGRKGDDTSLVRRPKTESIRKAGQRQRWKTQSLLRIAPLPEVAGRSLTKLSLQAPIAWSPACQVPMPLAGSRELRCQSGRPLTQPRPFIV